MTHAVDRQRASPPFFSSTRILRSAEPVRETDYCGLVSGTTEADKVKDCNLTIFYGKLKNAPLIEQCPVNLECKVVHALDLGSHIPIIGQIEVVHVSENCMSDGQADPAKIEPLMYILRESSENFERSFQGGSPGATSVRRVVSDGSYCVSFWKITTSIWPSRAFLNFLASSSEPTIAP